MNLKRVFAGVAAAATMLGGLALGATTANAETIEIAPTGTITVNNAQTGHTYTPYRFATFSNAQTVDGRLPTHTIEKETTMNLKRVFAGVAAAATMLGGLALGATTANAETIEIAPTGTITVNNAQKGHTYTPYLFATFSNAQTVDGKTYVDIDTVPDMVSTVRNAADAANDAASIPTEYTNNPAAYVATFNAQQLRQFADSLTESLGGVAVGQTPETDGENMSISNLATGWYAITDTFDDATVEGATAIVATPVNSTNTLVVNPKGDGQGNILVTGSYNAKSADAMAPTNVTKSVSLLL